MKTYYLLFYFLKTLTTTELPEKTLDFSERNDLALHSLNENYAHDMAMI